MAAVIPVVFARRSVIRGTQGFAERWVASARRGCADRLLITGRRHLAVVLAPYVDGNTAGGDGFSVELAMRLHAKDG